MYQWCLRMRFDYYCQWIDHLSISESKTSMNQIFKRLSECCSDVWHSLLVTLGPVVVSHVPGHRSYQSDITPIQTFNMITISLLVCWDIMGRGCRHKNRPDRELSPAITLITITQLALSPLYSVIHYTYYLNCWIWLSKNLYSTISFRANFIIQSSTVHTSKL